MSLTDLVIPLWVRVAACVAVVGVIAGIGYRAGGWVSDHRHAGELASAQRETEQAKRATAELQAAVGRAAGDQAQKTAQTVIARTNTSNEVTHAYIDHRGALERRISAGGLRVSATSTAGSGCRLPAIATSAGQPDQPASQSAITESGGAPEEQQVIEDAARDAQQLADLIEWVCRQGMCP